MNLRYLIPMFVLVALYTTGSGVYAQEYGSAFFYSHAHDQNQCSFDFSSKEYGTVSDGEFYFTDGKFFANNLGQRGLIDLGAIQFDPAGIEIPPTGYDQFGVEPIPQHVYISLSRAGNDNRYILFTVNYLTLEGNAVSLEYYILDTGTIIVNTNMAAGFEITGPRTFSGSGDYWKEEQIMTGEYTIRYNDLPGFETPSSQTKILNPGSPIVFEGQYNPVVISTPTDPTPEPTIPPYHDDTPPFTVSDTVLVAIIGTIGSIIAAYFGYKAVVKSRK